MRWPDEVTQAGWIKLNVRKSGHGQGIHEVPTLAGDTLVLLNAEQHMGRLAPCP